MTKIKFVLFAVALLCGVFVSAGRAQCNDTWVTNAVTEIVGRAPIGRGNIGECNIKLYGGGSWSNYDDLKNKVWAKFASEIAADDENQAYSRLCLDTQSTAQNSKIVAWPCHGGTSQQFLVRSDGTIRLFNMNNCLDARNGDGRDLIFAQCNGSATQRWYVNNLPVPENIPKTEAESASRRSNVSPGQIQNQGNSLCIDIKYGQVSSREIALWQCHGGQINRAWNQMFAAAPFAANGKAIVFFRTYQPLYQGHAGWAFRLADGRWIAGAQDGFSTPIIQKGDDNGWNVMVFEDMYDPMTKMLTWTAEQQVMRYMGGWPVAGQSPEITKFAPYDRYKAYDITNAHPAAGIQVAMRSKDWGYGVFGNNCVDLTVKVLRAYGMTVIFPGEGKTEIAPYAWFEQLAGGPQTMDYDKASARRSGCITCP